MTLRHPQATPKICIVKLYGCAGSFFFCYTQSKTVKKMCLLRNLTNKIQEGTCDQQVGGPIEAVGEGERPSPDLSGEYFTQEKPGHCSETRQSAKEEVLVLVNTAPEHGNDTSASPLAG